MSYQSNKSDHPEYEPWDRGTYRNGSTKPPKKHGGIVAILLVAVILLCGIASVLSLMNIRLFKKIDAVPQDQSLPIMFTQPLESVSISPDTTAATDATVEAMDPLHMETSPASVENIPQAGGLSLQQIYEQTIPSVVSIICTQAYGRSTGTGVILSAEGYIVTNCHVVNGSESIQVLLTDGRTVDASLVGLDEISDLAVLHITAEGLQPAHLGDSSVLRVGDTVVAIGDPLGTELRGTMTDGIISAINRDIDVDGRTMSLIQTNAALNSGNSGGPLINCYGQVIGINTMKMGGSLSTLGVEGLGFAIPSATVETIVNQLIENGFVAGRPELGIVGDAVSSFYQLYYRLPKGLYITHVEEGSAADKAGLSVGDILLSIDGTAITGSEALKSVLYNYIPGDTVQAIVYRSGKQYRVSITVGEANN